MHLTSEFALAPNVHHQTWSATLQLQQFDRALHDLTLHPDLALAGRGIILGRFPGIVIKGVMTSEFGMGHNDGLFGVLFFCGREAIWWELGACFWVPPHPTQTSFWGLCPATITIPPPFLLFAKELLAIVRIAKTEDKKISEYCLYTNCNLVVVTLSTHGYLLVVT